MWLFLFNSILLGVGLAMDAFSVSIANGLSEPRMRRLKCFAVAGTYSFFQFLMPMIGWLLIRTVVGWFGVIKAFVPYFALSLLLFIGIKMIVECIKGKEEEARRLTVRSVDRQALRQYLPPCRGRRRYHIDPDRYRDLRQKYLLLIKGLCGVPFTYICVLTPVFPCGRITMYNYILPKQDIR